VHPCPSITPPHHTVAARSQQEVKDRTRLTVKLDLNDADEVRSALLRR